MTEKDREKRINECIKALEETKKVLKCNIELVKDNLGLNSLKEKQEFISGDAPEIMKKNKKLLINSNILPPDLMAELNENISVSIYYLEVFLENYDEYKHFIESEFNVRGFKNK